MICNNGKGATVHVEVEVKYCPRDSESLMFSLRIPLFNGRQRSTGKSNDQQFIPVVALGKNTG